MAFPAKPSVETWLQTVRERKQVADTRVDAGIEGQWAESLIASEDIGRLRLHGSTCRRG